MLAIKNKRAFWVLLVVLTTGFVIHTVLGFYALFSSHFRFRLRPRHVGEIDVRGRTYHTFVGKQVDLKHRELVLKRGQTHVRTHLSVRRNILEHHHVTTQRALDYHKVGGASDDGLNLLCKTCAIVGYSAHLLGTNYGPAIDTSDCIFRMGLSPVKGFERDVGSRTDVRVLDGKNFNLLIKRPAKLTTGTQSSPKWVVFDPKDLDGVFKIQAKLPEIRRQYPNITIYTLTRIGESVAYSSMRDEGIRLGYKMLNAQPSTLWHTIQAASTAGCSALRVYGILDPKYCKTLGNEDNTRLTYWDRHSSPSCSDGADAGLPKGSTDHVLMLNDRRALLSWSQNRTVSFAAPQWPNS